MKIKLYNKIGLLEAKKILLDGNKTVFELDKFNKECNYFLIVNEEIHEFNNYGVCEVEIKEGVNAIKVRATFEQEVVKTWVCDNLVAEKLNDKIESLPEIEKLNKVVELLASKVDKLTELCNNLKADNEITRQLVLELNELDKGE